MENHQLLYLEKCKNRIEKELDWSVASQDWKQRDYLNLVSALEHKTGTSLSLSTVKRLWNENYTGNPHPATLDTLARFLDYEDWLSFQQSESKNMIEPLSTNSVNKGHQTSIFFAFVILFIFAIGIGIYFLWAGSISSQQPLLKYNPAEISFSCSNTQPIGVPNTVIFNYNLGNVKADSFFIQQSWNPFNRTRITQSDSVSTSIYYYPGVHNAKLIANDSIIKETTLSIYYDGWIAAARYGIKDLIPNYIDLKAVDEKPVLHVDTKLLEINQLAINDKLNINYFYVDDIGNLTGEHFDFEVHLKGDSLIRLTCPTITIMLMGSTDTHVFALTNEGCSNMAYVKLSKTITLGRKADLSLFGVRVYEEQRIKFSVKNKKGKIFIDDQMIFEGSYSEDIGKLTGFYFGFAGTGQVNQLKLTNPMDSTIVYQL